MWQLTSLRRIIVCDSWLFFSELSLTDDFFPQIRSLWLLLSCPELLSVTPESLTQSCYLLQLIHIRRVICNRWFFCAMFVACDSDFLSQICSLRQLLSCSVLLSVTHESLAQICYLLQLTRLRRTICNRWLSWEMLSMTAFFSRFALCGSYFLAQGCCLWYLNILLIVVICHSWFACTELSITAEFLAEHCL